MTITTNSTGTTVLLADDGRALKRKTDDVPMTTITRVSLGIGDSSQNWEDCDYGEYVIETKKYSKLKIEIALMKKGKLDLLDDFLDNTFIDGSNVALRRFYNLANDLSSSHPMFLAYLTQASQALGLTSQETQELLSECIMDED